MNRTKRREFKCVSKRGSKWYAYITFEGKRTHIGAFATAEEAAKAYDAEAIKLFGEFAQLNFP